jgi:hypothetical protein
MNTDGQTEPGGSLRRVNLALRNDAQVKGSSQLNVTTMLKVRRVMTAAKYLLVSWVVAALCILLPVVHFFLVPMGVLTGIVLFFRKMSQIYFTNGGVIACPKCQSKLSVTSKSFNFPLKEFCPTCRTEVVVTLDGGV